jgi:hypothetical protein
MTPLEAALREHGFKANRSEWSFKRREKHGFSYLSLPGFPVPGTGGYQVIEVGLGVRHDRVDDVVNQLGHIWGDANRKNTTTVYRGLGFYPFDESRDARKIVRFEHAETDAKKACFDILEMMSKDGLQFFSRYSDLLECSRGLNAPIETRTHPLCNNYPLRAYYGVAAAAFAEPERVPNLISEHLAYARDFEVVDNGVYDVAKDLKGLEAIEARLNFLVELALSPRP